jgi:hypothetical protein
MSDYNYGISAAEVWLRGWLAVAGCFNGKADVCTRYADSLLSDFRERFPPYVPPETQFCGVPLSELSDEERAEFRRTLGQVPFRAASCDTLPKGRDAQQGLAGTESGAVDAEGSETPKGNPHA